MSADFTKFAFQAFERPQAGTLTEAITIPPVHAGFVVLAIKGGGAKAELLTRIRRFAATLRSNTESTGFRDVTAYREFTQDEWGGAVPFDQSICTEVIQNARQRAKTQVEKYPALQPAIKMAEENDMADWTVLVEYDTLSDAQKTVGLWKAGKEGFADLTDGTASYTLGAFRNMNGYASISRDPNVIQFFNFFPGPGNVDQLWQAWQDALPWFFETGEMRSSFPLAALDPDQPLLIVNYAHFDSLKHFFLGVAYDPNYLETVTACYKDRGFKLPLPFFCKIEPV